jgi:Fibrinogen beta and gamma chains, C-terminal globular domain
LFSYVILLRKWKYAYVAEVALPTDCEAIKKEGRYKKSGIYRVQPVVNVRPFFVFCELSDRGGGWTVLAYIMNLIAQLIN